MSSSIYYTLITTRRMSTSSVVPVTNTRHTGNRAAQKLTSVSNPVHMRGGKEVIVNPFACVIHGRELTNTTISTGMVGRIIQANMETI